MTTNDSSACPLDLLVRLRTRPTGDPHLHALVHEAADEIERLRAEIDGIRKMDSKAFAAWQVERAGLNSQIARLESTLRCTEAARDGYKAQAEKVQMPNA